MSPRLGFAWTPTASQDLVVRGGAGLFFDRVPLRAVANALLSAGNTTDVTQLRQPQVSGILPTQAGAPVFPNILPDRLPSTTLVSITTMDRNLQNAYSKQANIEVERALGGSRDLTVGYQYFRGEKLLMSINQNVPTCVAAGTNNGCRPVSTYMNNSQYQRRGRVELPRAARDVPAAADGLVVGPRHLHPVEVDEQPRRGVLQLADRPADVMKDWGRSDNDQRHRLVVSGVGELADDARPRPRGSTSATASRPARCCSTYSSLPFNIVSGVNSLQGTAGRPFADGSVIDGELRRPRRRVHSAQRRHGSDFFTLGLRVSRSFRLPGGTRIEGLSKPST